MNIHERKKSIRKWYNIGMEKERRKYKNFDMQAYQQEYRRTHKEQARKAGQAFRKANPNYYRQYAREHPDQMREYRRRAREKMKAKALKEQADNAGDIQEYPV